MIEFSEKRGLNKTQCQHYIAATVLIFFYVWAIHTSAGQAGPEFKIAAAKLRSLFSENSIVMQLLIIQLQKFSMCYFGKYIAPKHSEFILFG